MGVKRFLISVLTLILSGCISYDYGDVAADYVVVDTVNPSWQNGIGLLVATKCANCHTANRSVFVPATTPTSYDNMANEDFFNLAATLSRVRARVYGNESSSPMPPNYATPLTNDELTALQTYVDFRLGL